MLQNVVLFSVALLARNADAAETRLVDHCVGDTNGDTVVINLPGFDLRTWGWIRLTAPARATVCDYEIHGDWGDSEVGALQREIEVFLRTGKKVVFVAYSMSAPIVGEVLDTSDYIRHESQMLSRVSVLLVAPAVEVSSVLRPAIRSKAKRWAHAWRVHLEQNILARRNHEPSWNEFIDRIILLQAAADTVVDNDAISSDLLRRLGSNVHVVPNTTHTKLRKSPVVDEYLHNLL